MRSRKRHQSLLLLGIWRHVLTHWTDLKRPEPCPTPSWLATSLSFTHRYSRPSSRQRTVLHDTLSVLSLKNYSIAPIRIYLLHPASTKQSYQLFAVPNRPNLKPHPALSEPSFRRPCIETLCSLRTKAVHMSTKPSPCVQTIPVYT